MKEHPIESSTDKKFKYLSGDDFARLSETEKSEYYDMLSKARGEARTLEEREEIAKAYGDIGRYKSASGFASRLKKEVEKQRIDAKRRRMARKKKLIGAGAIALATVILTVAVSFFVGMAEEKGKKYGEALALYNAGKYSEALEIFNTISSYKDVAFYVASINSSLKYSAVNGQRAREGDVISLGAWYADGVSGEMKEIEWIVLRVDVETHMAFVISKEILASVAYGSTDVWNESEVCDWLNGEFFGMAFSQAEGQKIADTLYGDRNENGELISCGSSKLALMSREEKTTYLTDLSIVPSEGAGEKRWWLRTASGDGRIMYIAENGQLATVGMDPKEDMGIRPVAWIRLD